MSRTELTVCDHASSCLKNNWDHNPLLTKMECSYSPEVAHEVQSSHSHLWMKGLQYHQRIQHAWLYALLHEAELCTCTAPPQFIRPFIHQWLYSPLLGPGLFFSSVIFFYTDGRTPWTSDQPTQARCLHTVQRKHGINRHLCLEWDSNPRSQCSTERRQFMPQIARPLWSAHLHN
jgi:hypothetical protein